MHLVERFADWAVSFRKISLEKSVQHHARRALIDWHAALYPGAVVPPATLLEKAFRAELDQGEAQLALGRRATPRIAALINGTAAHTVEVDDIYRDGIYHPGAPTIAAALALSEPNRILRAVTVGYEISTRIGAAMGDNPDWEPGLATLCKEFHITRMTFKNHACCGHTFAAIDGALELKKRMNLDLSEIESVEVATYRAGLEVAHYEQPRTPAEGRFSLKYVVASALAHGSVRLAAFEPERLADAATKKLMDRIRLSVDPELEAAFPAQRAARVAIRAHGKREEFLQPTRIGDPDAPLSDRVLEEKYYELATPVLGQERARAVLERLWRLE
jgi:2-methylcitrate dehydratase PrpD